MSKTDKIIKVEQVGSPIRRRHDQRETLVGLGLNKSAASDLADTPATRGMIRKVAHLVRVVRGVTRAGGVARAASDRARGDSEIRDEASRTQR